MHLTVIGINHKTAPIEVREKFSITKAAIQNGLNSMCRYEGLHEAVILSTCNRTEVYTVTNSIDNVTKRFIFDLIANDEKTAINFFKFIAIIFLLLKSHISGGQRPPFILLV